MECTVTQYLESKQKLQERICAIDALIDVMILRITEVAEGQNSSFEEYQLDDGQMKIKTRYRTVSDVQMGIHALETQKQLYVNRLNGRVMIARDLRSFR